MTQTHSLPSNDDNLDNDKAGNASIDDAANDDEYVADIDLGDSKKPKTPLSVIVAGIVLTILTIICLQVDDWSRDWTQNTSETDPAAKDVNMQPIRTDLTTVKFAELVVLAMKDVSRWKLVEQLNEGDDRTKLSFVHATFLMRYKDDVIVEIVKAEAGSTLYAKSQSRFGKGDLGQNPRNIKELISTVRQKLKSHKPKGNTDESKK